MRNGHLAVIAGVAVLLSQITLAQGSPATFDDASVRKYVRLAYENIGTALCSDKLCAPATQQELHKPPVRIADARFAMLRGFASAMGELCGLDWQNENFLPMMRYWRSSGKSGREVAVFALLHGIVQAEANDALSGTSCGSKAGVAAQLKFKPQ